MGSLAVHETERDMRMNIREQTAIIIQKDGLYLVGTILGGPDLRWSYSPWDAWRTRRRDKALIVADRIGGTQMLFNPVAGQLRGLRCGRDSV